MSGTGVTVNDCAGYSAGDLDNAASFSAVKAMLQSAFTLPPAALGSGILQQVNTAAGRRFSFTPPVSGRLLIGVHGGGAGGGDTAFYQLSLALMVTGLAVAGTWVRRRLPA